MFWINQHHNYLLDTFFKYITYFGEDYTWLFLLLYLIFVNYFQGIEKSKEIKILVISWLVKVFLSVSLKNIFNLPRPIEVYQNIKQEIHLVDGVEIAHWQSFPSGHTMTAFAFACFISVYLKQKKLAILALFVAILVGYSRMYLFQHFPRDVFAGGILGVSVVSIILTLSSQKTRRTTK